MKLLLLDNPEILELAAHWLAQKENYQWLDFGNGRNVITPALLKVMAQRPAHFMRAYTADRDDEPIGICCLNGVDLNFGSGTLWGAAGEKAYRSRGLGTRAASMVLSLAFRELGLRTINTWAVENNPSIRLIERLKFRYVGRQRQCHVIDGQVYDRLLFDLLASEHEEIAGDEWSGSAKAARIAEADARKASTIPAQDAVREVQTG